MTLLRHIPKVDRLLSWQGIRTLLDQQPRPVVLAAIRSTLDALRQEALAGTLSPNDLTEIPLTERVAASLTTAIAPSLRRVVNGTGVVVNTNLGRSPLAKAIREQLLEVACHYSNLEFDLEQGERGMRYSHVERLICELTGAEAALVVNNNAAAVLLALSSLASGREVVVSRGELVEIGGSFRIPDVMRQSGTLLREVGTTNRTHPRDYRQGVTPETALLLKVHCSNFAVVGFTAEVTARELVPLAAEFGLPVMADVGSGNLIDLANMPLVDEPTIISYLRAGVDVVTFSGDKLLGGPQAGIIVGKRKFIEPMQKHPLLRALRIDKMTLAALEGTLSLYRDPKRAVADIPTLRMLAATSEELASQGKMLLRKLKRELPSSISFSLVAGHSQVGGGALPLVQLPTQLIAVTVDTLSPQELDQRLRTGAIAVVGRIHKNQYLLDVRTILDEDLPLLTTALSQLVS